MGENIGRNYHYLLQIVSVLFGFFLMIGLSTDGMWVSTFVAVLIVVISSVEVFWIKEIKDIKKTYWIGASWLLLVSAIVYVLADSILIKGIFFWIMIIAAYINLYRTCYYETLSCKHIRNIIGDFPILCLYYIKAFFQRNRNLEYRTKQQKRLVGISMLIVVLLCVIFPLYILADDRIGTILQLIFTELVFQLPVWGICALIGIIPAMINYSIIWGLKNDIVLKNPKREIENNISIDKENIYWNETVIKILLIGLIVVNVIFIGLQVDCLFQVMVYHENVEWLYSMDGVLPLLIALGISILFIAISEYLVPYKECEPILSRLIYLYILSLVAILLLLLCRYGLKVINYGIVKIDIFGIGSIILFGIILAIFLRNMLFNSVEIIQKLGLWSIIVFVVFSLFPIEYCVSQINVQIFLNQYQRGEISETVTEQHIDLDFLKQMGYEAVPALSRLMDVSLIYEESNEELGKTVRQLVLEMFYEDMSNKEIEEIKQLETKEDIDKFINILDSKIEYRVVSKKKIAFIVFCDTLKTFIK